MNKDLLVRIVLSIIICLLVGTIGSLATQSSIDNWYVGLMKPSWSPPNWVFAPVWITLYILMGIAAGIVWNRGFYHKWVKTALYHFGFQLILNGMWSIIFFGWQEPFLALLAICGLFILVIFTIKWFRVVDRWSAALLIPYLLWLAFATALNFEIWRLN
ncbi:TspO/MBR family protein [uncultured Dokdonia sp.]|uniref:TspO/MBR family protein n=1 Tax=uncultured Dokdonia sp. TaxID=575653 RepID=UPI0026353F8A|nr:TspO/MBR family protein [uncultured Dokdonia sp.]